MAPDGFDVDGDLEVRNSAWKEASVLKQESGCGPCGIGYTSPSQNKKVDERSCFYENLPSRLQYGENIKGQVEVDGQFPLSPDNKGKNSARKSAKESIAMPSKRPRIDESENCVKNIGSNGNDDISSIVGLDHIRCTADKSQIIIQKRVHDGKKADRKNYKASLKNKYESLASKAALVCSDTFSAGNSIFGSHGVKSDILDMAKQLDELSLFDLLNGSYTCPMLSVDNGKKSSNANDNILLSVRKACSIMCSPQHVLAETSSNLKACQSSQDPSFSVGNTSDYETKDKQLEESLKKDMDTFQATWIKSTMHQPKKILDQLALPSAPELETFLFNTSMCCNSSQCTTKSKSCSGTNLPPFHWSFSHGVNSKGSVESYKMNATKNACQGKWVRIGSSSSMIVGDRSAKSSFPELVFTSHGDDANSLNQQKIYDVLEWLNSSTSTLHPSGEGLSNKSSISGTHPEVQIVENMNSFNGSGLLNPFNSETFQLHETAHTLSSNPLECVSKVLAPQEGTATVVSSSLNKMNLDPSKCILNFNDKAVLKDYSAGTLDGCLLSSFAYSCRNTTARSCDSSCLKCKQAYPQELLSAAATLLEMGRCQSGGSKCLSGRSRWPKAPSMKKMKARKSSASINNPNRSPAATGCNNFIKKPNTSSAEHLPAIQRKMGFVPPGSSGRESSRWSSSPNKIEKDLDPRAPHGNNSFRPLLAPFSSRAADKDHENHMKEPRARPSLVAFKGSPIRDWIRCRNKRL